ncbi:MAG: glycosyltransferase family 9 protein [Deltaproteobacteria bacterium]|nr:glycosyltransferase family 9 protein [Deltaproteobacteria bacterium]
MKILIIKPSSLGDVVHGLYVLKPLKDAFPQSEIHWLVDVAYKDLVSGNSLTDKTWIIDRSRWKNSKNILSDFWKLGRQLNAENFDAVIDLQGLFRSGILTYLTRAPLRIGFSDARELAPLFYNRKVKGGKNIHAVERYVRLINLIPKRGTIFGPVPQNNIIVQAGGCRRGPPNLRQQAYWPMPKLGVKADRTRTVTITEEKISILRSTSPRLRRTQDDRGNAQNNSDSKYYVVVAGGRWESKRWPAEYFSDVIKQIPMKCVLVGGKEDKEIGDEIFCRIDMASNRNDIGKTTLQELVSIIHDAQFILTNDSGPMHIAAALGTPVFALFGPTDPQGTGPYGKGHKVFQADLDCVPCLKKKCPLTGENYMKCMKKIHPETILMEIFKKFMINDKRNIDPSVAGAPRDDRREITRQF